MTERTGLITLTRTRALYVVLLTLAMLATVLTIVFWPVLDNHWCLQFRIPEYERSFGFAFGTIELRDSAGGTRQAMGFVSVEPGGLFERAGVLPGDIPRMHHGFSSLCGTLALASDGYSSTLDVVNVRDARAGNQIRREVTLPGLRH